eukprot:TRINITY_DN17542_c0_g1_i1.p1 TRINITY_DN17542_c0_g1~~TRINITY_DN17542_c0_g1_i1.p1  ORF type:complete len:148 (-),score=23.63 TRINITY_DN17542_c0_g1_i1:60-503(-)
MSDPPRIRTREQLEKEPLLNKQQLEDITGGDLEFEGELFELYEEQYALKRVTLQKALDDEDVEKAVWCAHDLKGSSANLGAERVRRISETMEHSLRDKDFDTARDMFKLMEDSYEGLVNAFRLHLSQGEDDDGDDGEEDVADASKGE